MYLHKSYCYPDMSGVINAIKSDVLLEGFGIIQTVTQTSADVLTINYLTPDEVIKSQAVTVPACDRLGFDNSYTGLTVDDSLELAWSVVLVLVIAFSIKYLKRVM